MPSARRSQLTRRSRYEPLIDQADAALLAVPLLQDQKAHLRAWATAQAGGETTDLGALVDEQRVPLNVSTWGDLLHEAPIMLVAAQQTGYVARRHVRAVARECATAGRWAPLLAASYAWGQGSNGYGPYRLRNVLTRSAGTSANDAEAKLDRAVEAMRDGSAADAYTRLRGAIPGLGPAFYTKFLYFAGTQVHPHTGPAPLILDAVVAAQIRRVAADRASAAGIEDAAGFAAWLWTSSGWSPRRYEVWLDFADRATQDMTNVSSADSSWPSRPDLLELAAFRRQLHPRPDAR